ncbi:glycosyltransferase family 4 protein [Sphingomonas sp. DT-51]|uniref:glycosyltransferase family 4 protein n=1 Tax=Sphingomonas sp. DT-51 TaxID=3396165 RepID=UPI003F1D59E4
MPDARVTKPRLLVSAYAFSPELGSEFAQGWNYVQQMKHHFRLTVLVGSADGRMGDVTLLDHPAVRALGEDVAIVVVPMDRFCGLIKVLDVRLGLSWLFVLALRRWHWLALRRARQLHRAMPFVAVHQLGPVGFRNPGYMYRLPIPSYWGPIGGFQYVDSALARRSDRRYGLLAMVRNATTFLAARGGYVARAVRGFDCLSFATKTNRDNFACLYRSDGPVLSDQATRHPIMPASDDAAAQSELLDVIWCGSVDARKNITLLIDIAAAVRDDVGLRFTVIGEGPLLASARARATKLALTNLTFLGRVAREEVQRRMIDADVLCFTSLSEANTSTLFEALEARCIPVALDLDGFSTNVTDEIGFRINPRQRWNAIVDDFAARLRQLSGDPSLRARLRQAIAASGDRYTWRTLADQHRAILEELIDRAATAARQRGAT